MQLLRIISGALVSLLAYPALAHANANAGWATGSHPLSDQAAAGLVRHVREIPLAFSNPFVVSHMYQYFGPRTNTRANRYHVTNRDLRAFRSAKDNRGRSILKVNPELRYVTGRTHLRNPSTDDVIQWGAHKWGIPVAWVRAVIHLESIDMQYIRGDLRKVSPFVYKHSPSYARVAPNRVYESLGIAQIKWLPDGSRNPGTQPLRWKSTAFNVDYLGATIRFFYDGLCTWCGAGYHRGDTWGSVGAWNTSTPWVNSTKTRYINQLKAILAQYGPTGPIG